MSSKNKIKSLDHHQFQQFAQFSKNFQLHLEQHTTTKVIPIQIIFTKEIKVKETKIQR